MKLSLTSFSLLAASLFTAQSESPAQEKQPSLEELRARPITTAPGKVGNLLRQWWKEGTAAGNAADFYDNRDGGHSNLNTKPYPQLQRIEYSPEEIKARLHWAAANRVRPGVVFGNSSTSAPPTKGGSNPRMYYANPAAIGFLFKQYAGNNLYIYPEHRDHDPGHNGPGEGFGDLYPANTPYLVISQGSSGSDQPFMRAVPFTLAAFRPEVKKKLTETGLLMPTVQMILRATSMNLKHPKEYLTGKAHPTVFEGSHVDDLAMIQMAHDITLETIPPLAALRVLKEDAAVHGRDFFEPGAKEQWADTPCAIARIWRGKDRTRTLLVSAEKSFDVSKKPLKHHWVILRGDPKRIRITPKNDDASIAEISVDYHERMPISPGSPLESNRVDIGVFVHNGHYFSAPSFITFFSLDSEARTYDEKGRILEIGHGIEETRLEVKDWPAFFAFLKEDSPRRDLFADLLEKENAEILQRVETEYLKALPERNRLDAAVKMLTTSKKEDAALKEARKSLQKVEQDLRNLVTRPIKDAPRSAAAIVADVLARLRTILHDREETILAEFELDPTAKKKLQAERNRLVGLGLATNKKAFTLKPLSSLGDNKVWTRYEQSLLDRYHGVLRADLLYPEFLSARRLANFVDPRLSAPRVWRDIYRHEGDTYLGWSRWDGAGVKHFNRAGHLIREQDDLGRAIQTEAVRYDVQGKRADPPTGLSLQMTPTGEIFTYEYRDDADLIGTVKERR